MINKNVAKQIVNSEFGLTLEKALKEYVNELYSSKEFKDLVSKELKEIKEKEKPIEKLKEDIEKAKVLIEKIVLPLNSLEFNSNFNYNSKENAIDNLTFKICKDFGYTWSISNIINDLYNKKITKEDLIKEAEKNLLINAEMSIKQEHYLIGWQLNEIEENILIKLQNMVTLSKEQSYENLIEDINKRVDLKKEIADLYQLKRDIKKLEQEHLQ